ncbi:MAG: glycosyltransferase family 39 protein [Gemmatimonadales bacterium]
MAEELKGRSLSGERLGWILFAGLVLLHVALALLVFDPKPFVGGDNAGYMILAESIETGQGYRDIHIPGAPRHGQYPPVYPAVLAIAGALGGGLITFKILSAVFTSGSLVFLFLLARRRLELEGALAVVAAFAVSPVLVYYSHWVLSEALFVLLTLVALWAAERVLDSWRWLALTVGFALLAYLTRSAGLPLVAALLVVLASKRRWRELAAAGGAALAVVAAWWVWGRLAAGESAQVYSSNFLFIDPYDPELGMIGPGGLLARVIYNIRLYAIDVLPESLVGVAPGMLTMLVAFVVALLLIALALVAWVRGIRREHVLELFVFFYVGLIVLWPEAWTDRRFLLPVLPAAFLLGAAGLQWCLDFLRAPRRAWSLPVFGAILVMLAVPGLVLSIGYSQRCMRIYRQGDELACYPEAWRAFAEMAYWVRDNTPEDAIVVGRKPRLFYIFAGRRGNVYPFTTDEQEMLAFLDDVGADYVVVVPVSRTTYQYVLPVVLSVPERFEVVHSDQEEIPSYVLKYYPEGDSPSWPEAEG